MRKIVFRADGNAAIGMGHVVRSLAFAHLLREDHYCIFAIQGPSEELYQQLSAVCHEVVRLPDTGEKNELIGEPEMYLQGGELVVLDGYRFGTSYQAEIKNKGCKLVCIDDIHSCHFLADAVINYTGGTQRGCYKCEDYTVLYTGPEYILLRQPFLKNASRPLTNESLEHVFVCMGGSDFLNLTVEIVRVLRTVALFKEVHVVTGSGYRHYAELTAEMEKDQRIRNYRNLNAEQMVDMMKHCGVAICSASSVSYEYLAVGGVLFVLPYADNQQAVRDYLIHEELAFDFSEERLNEVLQYELSRLQAIVARQKTVFDGKSSERLRGIIDQLFSA